MRVHGVRDPKTPQSCPQRAQDHRDQLLPGKGVRARVLPAGGRSRRLRLYRVVTSLANPATSSQMGCIGPRPRPHWPAMTHRGPPQRPRGLVFDPGRERGEGSPRRVKRKKTALKPHTQLGKTARSPSIFKSLAPPFYFCRF